MRLLYLSHLDRLWPQESTFFSCLLYPCALNLVYFDSVHMTRFPKDGLLEIYTQMFYSDRLSRGVGGELSPPAPIGPTKTKCKYTLQLSSFALLGVVQIHMSSTPTNTCCMLLEVHYCLCNTPGNVLALFQVHVTNTKFPPLSPVMAQPTLERLFIFNSGLLSRTGKGVETMSFEKCPSACRINFPDSSRGK